MEQHSQVQGGYRRQSTGSSELPVDDGLHTLIASAIREQRVDDEQQYGWVSRKEAQLLRSTECEIKPVSEHVRCVCVGNK